ncbi:MAG: hypothetical protein E7299_06835 [Lachnospiraceae bacterium]|nr:hypothetical protein [Lachnospiraceae bacterium]
MKKKYITIILLSTLILSGCCLKHDYSEPTCTQPATCTKCGETEGETLPHTWMEANCTEAKHCSVCNQTEGEKLAHKFSEPTCTEDAKCLTCGAIGEKAKGHDFKEADYVNPKTCQLCGLTEGEPKEKPTPENITPQSSVEDMIAAYPDEITPELQAKLDSITNYYEQDLLPEEFYKEDIYNTLYGPSQEELQAELERLLQGATSGSTQNSETEIPDALKALESKPGAPVKEWDPNFQASENVRDMQIY